MKVSADGWRLCQVKYGVEIELSGKDQGRDKGFDLL